MPGLLRGCQLPRAWVTDFAAFPARAETSLARLLLVIPDLIAPDLPALVSAARYPGTAAIPPVSRIPSLLALKLCVLAQALLAAFRARPQLSRRHPRHQRRFLGTP